MKKLVSVLSLGALLAAGAPAMASATIVQPNPCTESVSCEAHRIVNSFDVSTPKTGATAPTLPTSCGANVQCIKGEIDYGGIKPVEPSPDTITGPTPSITQTLMRFVTAPFGALFARFFSN